MSRPARYLLHIFVDRFGRLSLCVLGQLAGQHQLASALNSSCVHRRFFVVFHDVPSFHGDAVEGIMDESVHHVHGPFRHSDRRMDLLQHLENVQVERLSPLLLVSSRSTAPLRGSGRHCACGLITHSLPTSFKLEARCFAAVSIQIDLMRCDLISTYPDCNYFNSHSLKRRPTASHIIGQLQPLNILIFVRATAIAIATDKSLRY